MKNFRLIKILTFCGALPFLIATILSFSDLQQLAIKISLIYGAVIIAFMSGILWAVALISKDYAQHKTPVKLLIISNLITLFGCFAALFSLNWIGFLIEILCFLWLIWLEFELQKITEIFSAQYFKMRLQITAVVIAILLCNLFLLA